MRIEPTTILTISESHERKPAQAPRASASASTVVSLGDAAETAQTAATDPTVTARLDVIRTELEAGTYVVDLDKLSQRILIDDLERGG